MRATSPMLFATTANRSVDGEGVILHEGSRSPRGKRRIVCELCNYGWMSDLQDEASQLMIPMLALGPTDSRVSHTPADQAKLAAWATMTSMTAEFLPIPTPPRRTLHPSGA